jgi:hypothetical protein
MPNPQIKKVAFTFDYAGITNNICTKCGIIKVLKTYDNEILKSVYNLNYTALWDTGSNISVVSKNIVNILGLQSIGKITMKHLYGKEEVNTYSVSIFLPNNICIPSIKVSEGIFDDCDMLIGMDVITAGDFVITSPQKKTRFSFQIPSTHNTDYENEIK